MTVTATATPRPATRFGPHSAGILISPRELDRAEFEKGFRYELIHGVLIVSHIPLENERDPNEELGHWLRPYRDHHLQGSALDATLPEQTIKTNSTRRRADRVILAGLSRQPRRGEKPTIAVEFVSAGKQNRKRDHQEKGDEYMALGVQEYWIFNRFVRTLTAYAVLGEEVTRRVVREKEIYTTRLLPGFELPVGKLLEFADRWRESATGV